MEDHIKEILQKYVKGDLEKHMEQRIPGPQTSTIYVSSAVKAMEEVDEFHREELLRLEKKFGELKDQLLTLVKQSSVPSVVTTAAEWINPEEELPLEEHRGEKTFSYFIVTVQMIERDEHDDPAVTMLRFYADDMEWYASDGHRKYDWGWEVIGWMPLPAALVIG